MSIGQQVSTLFQISMFSYQRNVGHTFNLGYDFKIHNKCNKFQVDVTTTSRITTLYITQILVDIGQTNWWMQGCTECKNTMPSTIEGGEFLPWFRVDV